MNCWMHLKSISETPSFTELAVTPGPSVFDTMCCVVLVDEPPPPVLDGLLLLPHAANVIAIAAMSETSDTSVRRPFIATSPRSGDHKPDLTLASGTPAYR